MTLRERRRIACEASKRSYRKRVIKHPLFPFWSALLQRCGVRKGASEHDKKNYSLRGITICKGWLSFDAFESWCMTHGYRKGMQLDRIDTNKGYSPDNCRFVSPKENQHNRRDNIKGMYRGKVSRLADVYEDTGCTLDYRLVLRRVSRDGWSIEDAISVTIIKTKGMSCKGRKTYANKAISKNKTKGDYTP